MVIQRSGRAAIRFVFVGVIISVSLAINLLLSPSARADQSNTLGSTRPSDGSSQMGGPSPAPTLGVPGRDESSGTSSVGHVGGCVTVVTVVYFGPYCPSASGSAGGRLVTIKEVLGNDGIPGCWDTTLTADQLALYRVSEGVSYDWVLRRCVRWLVPDPVYPYPSSASIEDGLVALPAGSRLLTLTMNQHTLVDLLTAAQGSYPSVIAVPTGSGVARVNQHVAFHGAPSVSRVVNAGAVFMQARVIQLEIHPLGEGTVPAVSCQGAGAVPPSPADPTGPADSPSPADPTGIGTVCWYTFTRSSADQPNQAYPMSITATWDVRSSPDPNAPWDTWKEENNSIRTTHVTNQKVTEIHTIVVN